jgi:hypothetical protein
MQPVEGCKICPKYKKYFLKDNRVLISENFCSICANQNSKDLEIYCERNRFFQATPEPGEDFECYRFYPGAIK